jgi:hypothetical protein
LATLFCPQNGHFLIKMALFFRQSMGPQNGNFTHFLIDQFAIHFKNFASLTFCKPIFTGFAAK